jgi:hypothetical protein
MASSISVKQAVDFASELKAFIAILAYEGERSLVIGGAARIDVGLERLLKAVMSRGPRGKDDNLFDPDRPLGTFSAKIKLAYRLGLLDDDVEHALQLIRKIRNDFAISRALPLILGYWNARMLTVFVRSLSACNTSLLIRSTTKTISNSSHKTLEALS